MKRAFSLVELIVVIGIIGILAGVLYGSFAGGTESARAARCLSNMKNLANACQTYGMKEGHYPLAGNKVQLTLDESDGVRRVKKNYKEYPGWISTMTQGLYPGQNYSQGTIVGFYSKGREEVDYALTNGVLWKYVSGNRATYVCPSHVKACGKTKRPNWSYLMNAWFDWDRSGRAFTGEPRKEYGQLVGADRMLLFSEVPFAGYNGWNPDSEGGSEETDAILQFSSAGIDKGTPDANAGRNGTEEIGVNHLAKRAAYAHVAYADGHVEKLRVPMKNGKPDTTAMRQLTSWLCVGYDVSFDGHDYKRVK